MDIIYNHSHQIIFTFNQLDINLRSPKPIKIVPVKLNFFNVSHSHDEVYVTQTVIPITEYPITINLAIHHNLNNKFSSTNYT